VTEVPVPRSFAPFYVFTDSRGSTVFGKIRQSVPAPHRPDSPRLPGRHEKIAGQVPEGGYHSSRLNRSAALRPITRQSNACRKQLDPNDGLDITPL